MHVRWKFRQCALTVCHTLLTRPMATQQLRACGRNNEQHANLTHLYCLHLLALLQERLKDLSDKFNSELEADHQKFELLLQEKNEQELEYEEKLKQVGFCIQGCWGCTCPASINSCSYK